MLGVQEDDGDLTCWYQEDGTFCGRHGCGATDQCAKPSCPHCTVVVPDERLELERWRHAADEIAKLMDEQLLSGLDRIGWPGRASDEPVPRPTPTELVDLVADAIGLAIEMGEVFGTPK